MPYSGGFDSCGVFSNALSARPRHAFTMPSHLVFDPRHPLPERAHAEHHCRTHCSLRAHRTTPNRAAALEDTSMTSTNHLRVRTVVRVAEFARDRQLNGPPYGAVFKRLQAAAQRLPALALEQHNAHAQWQKDSAVVDVVRVELRRKHLLNCGRIGRRLFENQAGAEAAFKVPEARASASTLVAFSQAMAEFIAKDIQGFLDEDQPPDFLDRLRAVTGRLADLQRSIENCIARQKKATAALAKEIPPARKDIAILEGLLEDRLNTDGSFATGWDAAKRVGKRLGQPRRGKWNWGTEKPRLR
jgi:hypothetical protein